MQTRKAQSSTIDGAARVSLNRIDSSGLFQASRAATRRTACSRGAACQASTPLSPPPQGERALSWLLPTDGCTPRLHVIFLCLCQETSFNVPPLWLIILGPNSQTPVAVPKARISPKRFNHHEPAAKGGHNLGYWQKVTVSFGYSLLGRSKSNSSPPTKASTGCTARE